MYDNDLTIFRYHLLSKILKTYRVRGTELSFLSLVRSVDPVDRRCNRWTGISKELWAFLQYQIL